MPNLTIKSIPDELYQRLKKSASEHRHSMNREVIVCLERSLLSRRIEPGFVFSVFRVRLRIRCIGRAPEHPACHIGRPDPGGVS